MRRRGKIDFETHFSQSYQKKALQFCNTRNVSFNTALFEPIERIANAGATTISS
jgi:hypothetical protein